MIIHVVNSDVESHHLVLTLLLINKQLNSLPSFLANRTTWSLGIVVLGVLFPLQSFIVLCLSNITVLTSGRSRRRESHKSLRTKRERLHYNNWIFYLL